MNSLVQKTDYIRTLEAGIFLAHNIWPIHKGTCLVWDETEENVIVWAGPVELFAMPDFEWAQNCYAWQHTDAIGHVKILVVLKSEFIDSAKKAVEAAIYADVQPVPKHAYTLELFKKRLTEAEKALHEAHIKTMDLNPAVLSARDTMDRIDERFHFARVA